MPLKFQIKRGSEEQILNGTLAIGELAFSTDTRQVFTFNGLSKVQIGSVLVDSLEFRPDPGITGRWFFASDTGSLYLDAGSAWIDFNIIDNKTSGVAGEDLVQFDVVYSDDLDGGKYKKAINSDTAKRAYAVGIVTASGGISTDSSGEITLCGRVTNITWAWTTGKAVYVDSVAGGLTQEEPSTIGYYVRPIGEAISATEIWFDPQTGWRTIPSGTVIGLTGPTGPFGPTGPQGSTGNIGPTGPMGNQGSQGSQGPQGYQGDAGNIGPTGPMGNQGSQGSQGPQAENPIPSAIKVTVTQADHGFLVGNVIRRQSGSYVKALADASPHAEVEGVVESVNGNDFTFVESGTISGLSSLTDGTTYFLSAVTAGLLTSTEPDPTLYISKPVLRATGTTTGIVVQFRGLGISGGSSSSSSGGGSIPGGVLQFISSTQIKWSFLYNSMIQLFNNTTGLWALVQPGTEPTVSNTASDMGGDALVSGVIYDVYAKYVSNSSFSLEFAKWGTSTAGASTVANAWVTSTSYKVGQRVTNSGNTYACLAPHTSGTFATDLVAGNWLAVGSDGLGSQDGVKIYAATGAFVCYRFLGCVRLVDNSGTPNFAFDDNRKLIWNYYNKQKQQVRSTNTTASWTYNNQYIRESNGGSGQLRGEFLTRDISTRQLFFFQQALYGSGTSGGGSGIYINDVPSSTMNIQIAGLGDYVTYVAGFGCYSLSLFGYNWFTTVERVISNGQTVTFYGGAGITSGDRDNLEGITEIWG
jgi:hypothetical protein